MRVVEDESLLIFFELVRVSLGTQDTLSRQLSDEEWEQMFVFAGKQALIGICFSGLERLPAGQRPPEELLFKWFSSARHIEYTNHLMNQRTEETTAFFRSNGFKICILKGQGIALLYPKPDRRQSGDIDIWLDGGRERLYAFARAKDADGKIYGANYHHIHCHLFEDTEVEAHIYPCCLNNPFLNRKLHRLFDLYPPSDERETPVLAFNRIYILIHCFNHLVGHGVGMRQVMDYYYVLKQGFTEEERKATLEWLKNLRLMRFTAAMMWLMKEVFGLEERYLLTKPDAKEGAFLLEEICQTGNMGHFDERNWGSSSTPFSRFLFNTRRDIHFLSHYPHEIIWQPFFSIWMYVWRWWKGLL